MRASCSAFRCNEQWRGLPSPYPLPDYRREKCRLRFLAFDHDGRICLVMSPLIEVVESRTLFSTFAIDPTYGTDGHIVQQTDVTPVVFGTPQRLYVGTTYTVNHQTAIFIRQYNINGHKTLSFKPLTIVGQNNVGLVAVDADAYCYVSLQENGSAVLERYQSNGSRDRSYTVVIPKVANRTAKILSITPPAGDRNVVAVVTMSSGAKVQTYLSRFTGDGKIDTRFGDDGFVQIGSGRDPVHVVPMESGDLSIDPYT